MLNDKAATEDYDLSNAAYGEFNIENLDLISAEDATVVIDEASLLALSSGSNTLTVRGGSDDTLNIEGGLKTEQTEVGADGQTYDVYSVGAEGMLLVDQDINVAII